MKNFAERCTALSSRERELLAQEIRNKRTDPRPVNLPLAIAAASGDSSARPGSHGKATHSGRLESGRAINFSIFFFSDDGTKSANSKYHLLLEAARYADQHGFSAVWTPERHFQDFGGLYPNPAVLSAALAMTTKQIQLRAGSVVLPLHNPIRVAEEWSVVDNLSNGRVGVAFASGWHPFDFAISPLSFENRKDLLFENVLTVQRLWAGEALSFEGVGGTNALVKILPRPIQSRLPMWISIASSPASWIKAGELGAHVLTAIVKQPLEVLEQKIKSYRDSLAKHGHDPQAGQVAVMLHTFLGADESIVKEKVRAPLTNYFRSNLKQLESHTVLKAKTSIEFGAPDAGSLLESDLDAIAKYSFERYYDTVLLCGTPPKCAALVDRLIEVGVNEIACLIDFGPSFEEVMASLPYLNILKERYAVNADRLYELETV